MNRGTALEALMDRVIHDAHRLELSGEQAERSLSL